MRISAPDCQWIAEEVEAAVARLPEGQGEAYRLLHEQLRPFRAAGQRAGGEAGPAPSQGGTGSSAAAAAPAGEVDLSEPLAAALGNLLGVGLETGRIRAMHGAHVEMAARRLFLRSPQGRRLHEEAEGANGMLATLAGQPLERVAFTARGPGQYSLHLSAAGIAYEVEIDRLGVRVRSIEV